MKSRRPEIFISTTSDDLRSAREVAKEGLDTIGCHGVVMEHFPPSGQDVTEMLREKLSRCDALLHIVGICYGREPAVQEHPEFRKSYTQLEFAAAKSLGKPVYVFICTPEFPYDAHEKEPAELDELQKTYRTNLITSNLHFQEIKNMSELAIRVRELQPRIEELSAKARKQEQRISTLVTVTAMVSLVILLFSWWISRDTSENRHTTARVEASSARLEEKADKTQLALEDIVRQLASEAAVDETSKRVLFVATEKQHGLPSGTIARELPGFTKRKSIDAKSPPIDRARAAFAAGDYQAAEKLALEADTAASQSRTGLPMTQVDALELAGASAHAHGDYRSATNYFTRAITILGPNAVPERRERLNRALLLAKSKLPKSEPSIDNVPEAASNSVGATQAVSLATATVNDKLSGEALPNNGSSPLPIDATEQSAKANSTVTDLANDQPDASATAQSQKPETPPSSQDVGVTKATDGSDEKAPKASRESLVESRESAASLLREGKKDEAEAQLQKTLVALTTGFGETNPDTIKCRVLYAEALFAQEKFKLAEDEVRPVLNVLDKAGRAKSEDTLSIRTLLGMIFYEQGRFFEAAREHRDVYRMSTDLYGPNDPRTVSARTKLADVLLARRLFPEAEAEYRAILRIQESNPGPEAPETLRTRMRLVTALDGVAKLPEAESHARSVLQIRTKILGSDDNTTLSCRATLGNLLYAQGDYKAAEDELREVIRIRTALSSDDIEIQNVRKARVRVLNAQKKFFEAEREYRSIANRRAELQGPTHRSTLEAFYDLAEYLESQWKYPDALEFAAQAAKGARETLGATNQLTKKYELFEQKLRTRK